MQTYLAVMFGGALGTGARMWLSSFLGARYGETFPIGTLVVNVAGCLIIGFFARLTGPEGPVLAHPVFRQFVMIGILGGFTTFSSFSLQTLNLLSDGEWLRAGLNVLLSVALCMVAVWIGHVSAAALHQR